MALLSYTVKELYKRFIRMTISIIVFAMSPILMSKIGVWVTEVVTQESCVDYNCFWEACEQLILITLPAGIVMFLTILTWLIMDIIKLSWKKERVD